MCKFIRVVLVIQIIILGTINLVAQDHISPISSYSFNDNSVVDEMGFSELLLRNQADLYNDSQRGSVLRFSASSKSYAVFNKKLLNSDSCTISFFFLWENSDAGSWHQLFELHDPKTNTNLFFTPQNSWGNNMCSLISDNKEYNVYEAVNAPQLAKDVWMHIAISFKNKLVTIYINGVENSKGYVMFTPESVQTDSLFLAGNPHRSNNYYLSARLDDIKIFDKNLAANQVLALSNGSEIPAPENQEVSWEPSGNPIQVEIDIADKKQTIQNFGSSDGWNTERIGKYWTEEKKEKLAELLFSTEKDSEGNPKGIGLSSWRFNIGAGTAEQGDASRISNEARRTEGFLNADGTTYNWDKQQGQQWFLRKAVNKYNIHHVIGWQNSPPVPYTKNNLGFREYNAPMGTILKQEHFNDFARFLGDVAEHFDNEGIHFDYISPLNEPQWGWAASASDGTVTQEGTPWTNQEIYDVVDAIDSEFTDRNISTKIFIAEAGAISRMVGGSAHADNQLNTFWNKYSALSLLGKPSFSNIASFHSYFQDYGNSLVEDRENFYDKSQLLESKPELWQTEYSLLGNGYRNGYPSSHVLSEMECALSLAKVIMADLNILNTTGWQWWTTFEKGKHGGETRYCLVEAITKSDNTDGIYHLNKLFYTFGNFSHFIRPGMERLEINRSDNLTSLQETSDLMLSVYSNGDEDKLVLVGVNASNEAKEVNLNLKNSSGKILKNKALYLTNEYSSLTKQDIDLSSERIIIPAHSVITYTADLILVTSVKDDLDSSEFKAWYNTMNDKIVAKLSHDNKIRNVRLYSIAGILLQSINVEMGQKEVFFSTSNLSNGVYLVSGEGNSFRDTKKVVVVK